MLLSYFAPVWAKISIKLPDIVRIWKNVSRIQKVIGAIVAIVTTVIALYAQAPEKWAWIAKQSNCAIPFTKTYCDPARIVAAADQLLDNGQFDAAISKYNEAF